MTFFHSKFWAHSLKLKSASSSIQNLSRSIASARVDLNPHQVHAALFALQSPLSRGVILADEVGLGKTIEAGLVIAQKWAERKRAILLIVPAFLRKQWENELKDKFFLPSRILDSKGNDPFADSGEILICSYQFAAQHSEFLKRKWDLVVIDEAHRMRNVYKTSNKQAKAIAEGLKANFNEEGFKIVLLTATPLQNNLMELYGLVSIIDPYVFGDESTFRDRYLLAKNEEGRNLELKSRLEPLIVRTLRKQVQEYIPFTRRIAITQNFTPNEDEYALYEAVSAYLQRDDLAALPNSQRQLITLIMRRILASSSFALTHTLRMMIDRLEIMSQKSLYEEMSAEDIEALDEELKEKILATAPDEETKVEKEKVRREVEELKSYLSLAEKIQKNSKGDALLIALEKAFRQAKELGAQEKAIIFTESVRTQTYLYQLLAENGYDGRIIRINGSNSDPSSKAIYQEWLEKQASKERRFNKAVEMKAALVEAFRDRGTILLATEAAAEGANLQFASLVVNYDLPWNPQRIEQRIGRCHRYGQKHDVVVVNFLNTRNAADQRVFELLNEKFKLFDGVFGASDEVLGAIESGVDIEMRIHEVYQTCRTPEQIQHAFDLLRQELDEQIQENLKKTRQNILDHFDEDVSSLLKHRMSETENALGQREKWLLQLACFELGKALPENRILDHEGVRYCFDWRLAEENGCSFLREEDPFAIQILQQALDRSLSPAHIAFDYSSYPQKLSLVEPLQGQSGWLELSCLSVDTFEKVESLVFSGITDQGEILASETCEKLFQLQGRRVGEISPSAIPNLTHQRESLQARAVQEAESRAEKVYDEEVEKLEKWSEDLKEGLEREIKDLDKQIKEARKAAALSKQLAEKLHHQRTIRSLEAKKHSKRRALFDEQDRIDLKRDELIARHEKRLTPQINLESLFTIRWSVE